MHVSRNEIEVNMESVSWPTQEPGPLCVVYQSFELPTTDDKILHCRIYFECWKHSLP